MADSLFWAQIEHDLAPVTRDQHPGPSNQDQQPLEQAIYSYAATWLTKSTCGCRCLHPNKRVPQLVHVGALQIEQSV